jgi:hypothetical protein
MTSRFLVDAARQDLLVRQRDWQEILKIGVTLQPTKPQRCFVSRASST